MTFKEAIISYDSLLLDFYSKDCPPCVVQEEILKDLQAKDSTLCKVLQVDKNRNPEVFKLFRIKHLPHLKYFKKTKPMWEYTGILEQEEIESRIVNA